MPDINAFVTQNTGKLIDVDGAFGVQCVDLVNLWLRNFNTRLNTGVPGLPFDGYAGAAWYAGQSGMTKQPARSTAKAGWVVIWGLGNPGMPLTHTAIVLEDKGNQLVTFSSNSPQKEAMVQTFSKLGVLGYFEPTGNSGDYTGATPDKDGLLDKVNPLNDLDLSGVTDFVKMLQSPDFWKRAGIIVLGALFIIIALVAVFGKSAANTPFVKEVL